MEKKKRAGKLSMSSKKRNLIIASSILLGTTTVGGTVYAYSQHTSHQESIDNATASIKLEQETLDQLFTKLESYELEGGFLSKELNVEELGKIEKSLNSVKDSYIDFHIEKDDLKSDIKVIKLDKKELEEKLEGISTKLTVQDQVNALFAEDVIVGSDVSKQALADGVKVEKVDGIKESVTDVDSKWGKALTKSLDNAVAQVKQIDKANKAVAKVFKDDKVVEGVDRDAYKKAKSVVKKVENEKVSKELNTKLDKVLKVVKADEAKAKQLAEEKEEAERVAKEKAEAEAQAQAQSQQSSSNSSSSNSTSSSSSSNSSNSSSGSSSSNTSKSSGSTSSKSSSSTSKSSSNTSSSSSKSSSSGSGGGSSSNSSSGSKSSGSSSSGKTGNVAKDVKKTGEGKIYDEDGTQSGTYEEGTFTWDE